jgi:hypothetical protein
LKSVLALQSVLGLQSELAKTALIVQVLLL